MKHQATRRLKLNTTFLMPVGVLLAAAVGCVPVGTGDHVEEALSAHVVTTPADLKTLDEVSFAVEIEDAMGNHTTDMEEVRLEIREVGGDWVEITLTAMTDHFEGTRTFSSSGEYELRVLGLEHMGHMMEEMHTSSFQVERAHTDVGPFHIEYESDPGHIHAGEESVLMFWVAMDDSGEAATGLTVQIVAEESDGHMTTFEADEVEPGVYQAMMDFVDGGEAHVAIVLLDENGQEVEADFHFNVADVH